MYKREMTKEKDTVIAPSNDVVITPDEDTAEKAYILVAQSQREAFIPKEVNAEPEEEVKPIVPILPTLEYNPVNVNHEERKENIKSNIPENTYNTSPRPLKQEIYSHVNVMPQFPGGEEQLKKWLKSNLYYPETAVQNRQEGKVVVRFVVYADGSIGEIQIRKSVNPVLDKEALRVINMMPNWAPGMLDDTPVSVWCALPIVFELQ